MNNIIDIDNFQPQEKDQLKILSKANNKSPFLIDILEDAEGEGCPACFV